MNAESALIVAVVVAITIILSVSLVFNESLDEVGKSLFGENSDGEGFFSPSEQEFPTTEDSSNTDFNFNIGAVSYDQF